MAGLVRMSLDSPEETRSFKDAKGKLELVNLAEGAVGRAPSSRDGSGPST